MTRTAHIPQEPIEIRASAVLTGALVASSFADVPIGAEYLRLSFVQTAAGGAISIARFRIQWRDTDGTIWTQEVTDGTTITVAAPVLSADNYSIELDQPQVAAGTSVNSSYTIAVPPLAEAVRVQVLEAGPGAAGTLQVLASFQ